VLLRLTEAGERRYASMALAKARSAPRPPEPASWAISRSIWSWATPLA